MRRSISSAIFCFMTSSITTPAAGRSRAARCSVDTVAGLRARQGRGTDLDAKRHLGLEIVVDEHDEGITARFAQLQVVQREDLVRRDRLPRRAVRNDVAPDLEH